MAFNLNAQDFYKNELQSLYDITRLPYFTSGEIRQISSYDRTGNNDDGFSGKYSFIREESEGKVIAELKGPGIVNRIWTPTPEADTVKFYFDGEAKPRINIPFIDLFSGKVYPFTPPLCDAQLGGYFNLIPIPYKKSLKIIYTGKNLRFLQLQYKSLAKSENIESWSDALINSNKEEFQKIADVWNKKTSPLQLYGQQVKKQQVSLMLVSGKPTPIFSLSKGARIVGIELGASSALLSAYRQVSLTAIWDNEKQPAIAVPLHDFFGFAFGNPAMQSVLLGSDKEKLYSYLPMPFRETADLTLTYTKSKSNGPDEIFLSGTIYYVEQPLNEAQEGKFYIQSRRHYNIPPAVPHTIADIKGNGHYIGTILQAQGLEEGHTGFWEGDDVAIIDGKMQIHGTGSEDYFNGGYYAIIDKWDQRLSLPFHGCLAYDLSTSRTGGYRFYLNDKLNFSDSLLLTIEHQPEPAGNIKVDYTSLGLFYAKNPYFENSEIAIDDKVEKIKHKDQLTAQGMIYSLYWLATADYQDPAIVFGLNKSDSWTASVDIEAVPIVQISLHELDNGKYKVYVDYDSVENGNPFSIWQRSKQVSDWIPANIKTPDNKSTLVPAGEIEITDEVKTITIRKKINDNTKVKIYRFLFEKM